ncbi:MAG: deoxynucleoside kinase [Acidobacteriota bacterium]|nr:deoxynucleoside kinase [Acidobacteriota bacterium]
MSTAPPSNEHPRLIAIEGPLRVGKTSLADLLAKRLGAARLRDVEDNPFLDRFYRGAPGAAFQAQLYFLWRRFEQWRSLDQAAEPLHGIVSDYLFAKDKIFAYLNLADEELELYEHYYELFAQQAPIPDLVIYLQARPGALKGRIAKKSVPSEQAISDEYLEEVIRAYEHFFFHYRDTHLLVVETSKIDFIEREDDLEDLLRRIRQPVKGMEYFLPLGSSPQD